MTPVEIKVILHYYSMVDDYPVDNNEQFIEETLQRFVSLDMLKPIASIDQISDDSARFIITSKGVAYVNMLKDIPIPVVTYVDPRSL